MQFLGLQLCISFPFSPSMSVHVCEILLCGYAAPFSEPFPLYFSNCNVCNMWWIVVGSVIAKHHKSICGKNVAQYSLCNALFKKKKEKKTVQPYITKANTEKVSST